MRNSLLPTLKPEFWYGPYDDKVSKVKTADGKEIYALTTTGFNGSKTYHEVHPYPEGYTADRANAWLVGIARIRQLRVLDSKCPLSIFSFIYVSSCINTAAIRESLLDFEREQFRSDRAIQYT